MPILRKSLHAAVIVIAATTSATAGGPTAVRENSVAGGWDWLATTGEIQTEGVIWNDRLGDGQDRWKTGGLSQSYIFPEHIFSDGNWFDGRASGLELNLRALVMTPDDTSYEGVNLKDRPYAQFAATGVYLRSITRPRHVTPALTLQEEDRVGIEVGWQGEPLPLFEVQNGLHGMAGTKGDAANLSNVIDGEWLVNLDARRTWRLHRAGIDRDRELAPFVQGSIGMREVSLRVGADYFIGSALEGRTWGSEPATGAVMAGAAMPRRGFNWTVFVGGDVGYIASDAFLDGGFAADGPSVPREKFVGRARTGLLLEYNRVGVGFSLNWLSPEFKGQPEGQVIGAVQLKYRF